MDKLLNSIHSPEDIKTLSIAQLKELAEEIRDFIIHSVANTGGHLASNLGMVELTLAMHYVYDFKSDKLLWDVGHQCYTHKIVTGRKDAFEKLRKSGGVSGFPNPAESPYDVFTVGHAGTSIATAMGLALGAQNRKSSEQIVALVGDASIVNGLNFEALNCIGLVKRQMLVVLNDNSMAIDVTQGSMAKLFSKVRLSQTYEEMRKTTNNILEHVPVIGKKVEGAIERFKKTIRMANAAGQLFESMNIAHFGPVDGHDIGSLVDLFKALKHLEHPAILHVYTRKGKGFSPADDDPCRFHSTGPFEVNGKLSEPAAAKPKGKSYTQVFGESLVELAEKDNRIVALTAAMPDGTGLADFRDKFPDRYFDVGIAESAAVDIAAGQARQGLRPFVCVYSTFLQRSFDQIAHEISLQNLPVVFCIDRAGVVGDDGPTHHGLLDIGFVRMLPNMELIAPACGEEVRAALEYALNSEKAVAIRYPRQAVPKPEAVASPCLKPFETGKSVMVYDYDSPITLISYGAILGSAMEAVEILQKENIYVNLMNARFAKPLDEKILEIFASGKGIITLEDHSIAGGFGSAVMEFVNNASFEKSDMIRQTPLFPTQIMMLGAGDEYITHQTRDKQLDGMNLSPEKIAAAVRKMFSTQINKASV